MYHNNPQQGKLCRRAGLFQSFSHAYTLSFALIHLTDSLLFFSLSWYLPVSISYALWPRPPSRGSPSRVV
ncbi:MAG: hypothetical protein J3Q66DRAFT_435107 [Benniella sp.]|nr:MAG: hypothetical protein J3Q66DRAFT_435107 [Benniella sp.]